MTQIAPTAGATLDPTPNADTLPRRLADFATFADAVDYAAKGVRGLNFHDPRGNLARVYPYSELREDALAMARRLIASGVQPGDTIVTDGHLRLVPGSRISVKGEAPRQADQGKQDEQKVAP